jgi:hypothetical protein
LNEKKRKKEEERLKDLEYSKREEERIMKELHAMNQQHEKYQGLNNLNFSREITSEGKKTASRTTKAQSNNSIRNTTVIDLEPKQPPPYITNSASKASANEMSQDNPMKSNIN